MTSAADADVIAYVDGRLEGAARDTFEARLANDPALVRQVAAHRWMSRQIVAAFGVPPGDEIDESELARLGLSTGNVVDLAGRSRHAVRRSVFGAIAAGALAAGLVAGVLLDRTIDRPDAGMLQADGNGRVFAQGELADSLSHRLSGEPGPVKIGLSFRTAQGICRTFSTPRGLSGIGCREGNGWSVPIVSAPQRPAQESGEYRLAGGAVAPAVMARVDTSIVGDPLAPAQEKALIARDWQAGR
ncbi:hypothetical protein RXV95_07830 [Novosphingobium sp. ZN18A2]|uniref:hypothetical protein n=1 Tax=Novosphingobium sp. ZN18A2 TaxID=3079861 RepID=UPI0030D13082